MKKLFRVSSSMSNNGSQKIYPGKDFVIKSDSYTNEAIADKLDITVPTVRLCLQKYFAGGIDNALNDCKGKGRKQEISDDDITWVVNKPAAAAGLRFFC